MAGLLEGRAAIVTGAASGVGLAVARRFAEEGARLLLTDTDEAALDAETEVLTDAGAEVHTWICDLRAKLGVANLVASAADRLGEVDILVNAAGATVQGGLLDAEGEAFDRAYQANLRSVFLLSQAVARRMIAAREAGGADRAGDRPSERPSAAIVNVSSIAASRTVPELLPYSVACAALDQLTRAMAVGLAPKGVRVNGVALGAVMTRTLRAALKEREGLREAIQRTTPLGRIGEADEAAEAALFLASPRASYVTGQVLTVDGGRTLLDPLSVAQFL
jgi:7-alpha-hydroxysteroid dehydrogenase